MPKQLAPRGNPAPPVEPNVAPQKLAKKPAKKRPPRKVKVVEEEPAEKMTYIRNGRAIFARFTLSSGRRIELEPRGQRNDINVVSEEETRDPYYIANLNLLFHEISAESAAEIISKQQTNANPSQPRTIDMITNEKGESYAQEDVHVDPAFERQGFVVGTVEPASDGRHTERNTEVRPAGPQTTQVPGSVGHQATADMGQIPDDISAEDIAEFMAFKRAQAAARAAEEQLGQ